MSGEVPVELAFDTSQIKTAMRRFMDEVVRVIARKIVQEVVFQSPAVELDQLAPQDLEFVAQARIRLDEEIRSALTIPPQYLGGVSEGPPAWSGPTSACWDCGARVPPKDLWVGKKSGVGLCEGCMGRWEKAGRAKRSGDF